MNIASVRARQLEDGIQKDLDLLKEYEDSLRLSGDPKDRARCREEIERLRASLADKQTELRSLSMPGPAAPIPSGGPAVDGCLSVDIQHLCTRIASGEGPDPVWLLGAGASQSSGVPLSGELVERAAQWAYCRVHQRPPDDVTVMRSDWLRWLHAQAWYQPDLSPSAQYVIAFNHLFHPAEERREFFRRFGRMRISPGKGYYRLLDLMAVRRVRTVLTTNFDTILCDLSLTVPNPRDVATIRSPAYYQRISTAPVYPQVIYLHGDVEWYTDHYFGGGYQRLDDALVGHLIPLVRDHPLVVVGYSGSEEAVMRHLLLDNAEGLCRFRCGLYWCVLESESPHWIHPLVNELAAAAGPNFCLVPIGSFDQMCTELWHTIESNPSGITIPLPTTATEPPTFDLQPLTGAALDELDWSVLQQHLVEYCRTLRIDIPSHITSDWLSAQMQAQGLAAEADGTLCPTIAGALLFAKNITDRLPTARVEVHIAGEEPRTLGGNLWQQLAVVNLIDGEFNVPFRLKGPRSETVTPYPALALKELIVNALAHRRYDGGAGEAVVIRIEKEYIRITNPGGLLDEACRQLPEGTPPEEALGTRPIKGYRNPVIADFLYGSGEMDKLGSGLVDVRRWARQNGGNVVFHPGADNAFFEAVLFRRPERPNAETGAASPLTLVGEFTSNVLEVTDLPNGVWSDETAYSWAPQILKEAQDESLPAFVLYDKRLHTFTDLSQLDNPLRRFVTKSDIRSIPLSVFCSGEAGSRRLVHLLNEVLRVFTSSLGLIFDWKRKLGYFPRTDEGERPITYQARLRKATRTVVKPRISASTNEIIYWEHQAVAFHFKRFGEVWGLQLLPTYVFTFDGYHACLPAQRSGPLVTRRVSREYNVHVDSHLAFWTTALSGGLPSISLEDRFGSRVMLSSLPGSCMLKGLEAQVDGEGLPPLGDEDLDEMEEHFSELNPNDWEDDESDD